MGKPLPYDSEWVKENITGERIIMHMIHSFSGRMHLASHLDLLTKTQVSFVEEKTTKRLFTKMQLNY